MEIAENDFQNEIQGNLNVQCPDKQVVTGILSEYWYPKYDRLFKITCSPLPHSPTKGSCKRFLTEYVAPIVFVCPADHFLTGVYSHHSQTAANLPLNDRRWRYTCCQYENIKTQSCEMTGFINEYKAVIDYQAIPVQCSINTTQMFFTGLYGIFDIEET